MKKVYMLPVTEIIEMDTAEFIAISTTIGEGNATGAALSRELDLDLEPGSEFE
jgi:hypothetical protein